MSAPQAWRTTFCCAIGLAEASRSIGATVTRITLITSLLAAAAARAAASPFGQTGLTQAREIGGLGQRPDLGIGVPRRFLDGDEAGIALAQLTGFGERRPGPVSVAFEGIGGGKVGVNKGQTRICVACLLEPHDRLVD